MLSKWWAKLRNIFGISRNGTKKQQKNTEETKKFLIPIPGLNTSQGIISPTIRGLMALGRQPLQCQQL